MSVQLALDRRGTAIAIHQACPETALLKRFQTCFGLITAAKGRMHSPIVILDVVELDAEVPHHSRVAGRRYRSARAAVYLDVHHRVLLLDPSMEIDRTREWSVISVSRKRGLASFAVCMFSCRSRSDVVPNYPCQLQPDWASPSDLSFEA